MGKKSYELDYRTLSIMALLRYKGKADLIEQDKNKLNGIVIEYLKENGAMPVLLTKPGVVERVKKILFENMLLSDGFRFDSKGHLMDIQNDFKQCFAILDDGSIIFYKEYMQNNDKLRRIAGFDVTETDEVEIMYCESVINASNPKRKEYKISLDEFGFDTELQNTMTSNTTFREYFKPIITHVDDEYVYSVIDSGNYGISPQIDNYFLGKGLPKKILPFEVAYDILGCVRRSKVDLDVYPLGAKIEKSKDIDSISANYRNMSNSYQGIDEWYISRYGKEFLVINGMLKKDSSKKGISFIEKIKRCRNDELALLLDTYNLSADIVKRATLELYNSGKYYKSLMFLKVLDDENLEDFVLENDQLALEFIANGISLIKSDEKKLELFEAKKSEFDIKQQVDIINTLDNESEKVKFYEENLSEILSQDEADFYRLTDMGDIGGEVGEVSEFLSQTVLDGLEDHDNRLRFLSLLKDYTLVKYETIHDFSKEEIYSILQEREDGLSLPEYAAVIRTGYFSDEGIIEFLEDNWSEGLEIASDPSTIELNEGIEYTFREYALVKVKDDDKKVDFLTRHIDDYGADEITTVLKDLLDTSRMIALGKKFELPKNYYIELLILSGDEPIFDFIESEESLAEEEMIALITFVDDMPRAFRVVEDREEFNAIQKLRILSQMETDMYENQEQIQEMKISFLKRNKQEIIFEISDRLDIDSVNDFLNSFSADDSHADVVEELKSIMEDKDGEIPEI